MGDGDILSSTIDMPQASSTNRFSNFNTDRCVSTHQINVTGFIDDTYRNDRGTQLEVRIRTRSRGGSNSINIRFRDVFSQLKVAVYEWGERFCSSAHTVDVIEREHSALCTRIEQKTSEILLGRGDYNLVGELGSLKDKLNGLRKEAKQLAQARVQPDHPHPSCGPEYDERLGEYSSTKISVRRSNMENVFMDEPIPDGVCPNIMERNELNLSRIDSVLARGQEPIVLKFWISVRLWVVEARMLVNL